MAGAPGSDARALALLAELAARPDRFDLFQALRRIECAFRDRPRLGEGVHAADEPVRLAQDPSLAFALSALVAVEHERSVAPRLVTSVLGLLGPHGPLPTHLTEYARDRARNAGDETFARFLDLFHHRVLALYYRAWANAEPAVQRDRPARDRFALYVGALAGMALPALRDRDAMPDTARLFYAGRLAPHPKNAEGLRDVVAHWFGVPARVEQFVGEWVELPARDRWRLGGIGAGKPLGRATLLGTRAYLRQGKFRLVLGPLGLASFEGFLPGGVNLARLAALVRGYAGDALAWDVRLELEAAERPGLVLGRGARLGWTSWLGARGAGTASSVTVRP